MSETLTCWWCRVVNAGPMVCNNEQTLAMCVMCVEKLATFFKVQADTTSALKDAAEDLLAFIRAQHPSDFQPGGRGYICPHHIAIADALGRDDMPPPAPKLCDKCHHPVDDHEYSWSGPWDWWECSCGCKLGE